ncbi:MAG: CarD family transcriptional regulator [Hyphomicrobium aestuarii]|nr:CarD family transcriptional regulator [Hyphomicrobium aestuarii]
MAQKKPSTLGSKASKTSNTKLRGDAKISDVVKSKSSKVVPAKAAASRPVTRVAANKASAKPAVAGLSKSSPKSAHSKAEVGKTVSAKPPQDTTAHAIKSQSGKPGAAKAGSAKAPAQAAKTSAKTGSKAPVQAAAKSAVKPTPQVKAPSPASVSAAAKPLPKPAVGQQRPVLAAEKAQGPKITGPAPAAAAPPAAKAAPKPAAAPAAEKKFDKLLFKINEYVVYPTQGVGKVIAIEEEEIAGMKLELFKIEFEKERLVLRVPMGKVPSVGMRKIADDATVKRALETLKGRARIKRTMWSRRAQEYVAKINSGNLTAIAEVVRDLYRSEAQPEQSYSERQLYENALERMAREVAIVERLDERGAVQRITEILSKSAKGRAAASEVPAGDDDVKAA